MKKEYELLSSCLFIYFVFFFLFGVYFVSCALPPSGMDALGASNNLSPRQVNSHQHSATANMRSVSLNFVVVRDICINVRSNAHIVDLFCVCVLLSFAVQLAAEHMVDINLPCFCVNYLTATGHRGFAVKSFSFTCFEFFWMFHRWWLILSSDGAVNNTVASSQCSDNPNTVKLVQRL